MDGNVFRRIKSLMSQFFVRRPASASSGNPDNGTSYLKYDSVEEWMSGEDIPNGFAHEPDPELRDRYIRQYGELRRHLYARHMLTLSAEDQTAINDGHHPSQSHRFADDALPYCELLQRHLESLGLTVTDVQLGWYHMDRIVLSVETPEILNAARFRTLPWLFQGFEVKYTSTDPNSATEQVRL